MKPVERIPRVIHYCWFGGRPFGNLHEKCFESWKRHLPGYRFRRWDESNAPLDAAPFVRDAFRRRRWAFVADYVRISVLLQHGGIYMDTDMLLLKPLDGFLHHRAFAGFEDERNVNFALAGAEPEHPFLRECLECYDNMDFNAGPPPLIPHVVSDRLRRHGMTGTGTVRDVTLYPCEYFYPWPFDRRLERPDFQEFLRPESHAVHLWNHSWRPETGMVKRILRSILPRKIVDRLRSIKHHS